MPLPPESSGSLSFSAFIKSIMPPHLFKSPVNLLLLVIFIIFLFILLSNFLGTGTIERDQEDLAAAVKAEAHRLLDEGTRSLEDRIRFLEEDAVFKSQGKEKGGTKLVGKMFPPVKRLMESERKRILITGGCGFVGSHLADKLMRDGHEVTVVDNFFTGRKRNVEHWIGHDNFELMNHDIILPLLIEVDQIYHLASPASPIKYMYNPVKTIKTNTVGTLNMLGLAKRVKARFLQASTSEVYGDPTVHPQHEGYWGNVNPIGPRACYDEGKRVAETMVYAYAKQDNVDVRVARIFNTYGPRMHMFDGRVVSNFIIQALQGNPLTVISPGNQTRSFMYISDLVSGLIELMNSNYTQPVNLGNPDEHSILEFANIIKKQVGLNSEVKMVPPTQDDPRRRKPDISRAQKELKWKPVISLEEGLHRTIEYFKSELSNSSVKWKRT